MADSNFYNRLPCVVYRIDVPEHASALIRLLGADVEVRPVDSDSAARHLLAELGDMVAAVIVDQANLVSAVDSPVFQAALTSAPHALRVLLHDDLSLEAIQSLLKSRLISRCFNKPVDAQLLRSEIVTASLKLEPPTHVRSEPALCEGLPGVLIVDDEKLATKYLKKQLEQCAQRFAVFTADSAEAALALLQTQAEQIAVVISDQRMPGVKGDQFLNTLKRSRPDVLRILTSAYQEVDVALNAVNNGEIYRYLSKPWALDEVLQCIHDALEEFSRKRQSLHQKSGHLMQQYQALQAQRKQVLAARACQDLEPFADAAVVSEFMNLLAQIETLPVSMASINASQTTSLEQELVDGFSDALRLSRRRLQAMELPVDGVSACAALIVYLAHPSDTGRKCLPICSEQLLLALETLLQASNLDLSALEVSDAGGSWHIRLAAGAQLSVYTHLLAPLTRVTRQLLAQQAALLLLFVLVRLLNGRVWYQVHQQSVSLSLVLPARN